MWLAIDPLAMFDEADVAAAGPTLLGGDERQVDGVGDEIGLQQETDLLALGAEIVGLAGEAVLEVIGRVEDEIDIVIEIEHRWAVGHRHEAHDLLSGAV